MNDKDEIKRLRRLLAVAFIGALVLSCLIVAWASYEIGGVKRQYMLVVDDLHNVQLKPGENGKDGLSIIGERGRDGKDGQDSMSTTVIKETAVPGPEGAQGQKGEKGDKGNQGDKGETGQPGAPGKTIFTRTNILTGEGECRFAGDDEWVPESECENA